MLSTQTATHSRNPCFPLSSAADLEVTLFDDDLAMQRLRKHLGGVAMPPDARRALADAVPRHGYASQRSLDLAGLADELGLRWQRASLQALLSIFKTPAAWTAIAADLLPAGASLRHVVLPFMPDSRELSDIVLAAFAAGITSVEVTFPPSGHASSPYRLDLSGWGSQGARSQADRLVLWIKCVPDAEGSILAPKGVDLGVHPLTGVHVPGVRICEPAAGTDTRAANNAAGLRLQTFVCEPVGQAESCLSNS